MEASSMGMSLLEQKAIGGRAGKYYKQEYHALVKFASSLNLSLKTPTELDSCLNKYFNHLFLQGQPAHRGDKILATVMHHHPQYGKQGSQKLQESLPAVGLGGYQLRDAEEGLFTDGFIHHDGIVSLHTSRRAPSMQSLQLGEAKSNDHRVLDFAAESGGAPGTIQGGRIRRQCRTRLALSEILVSNPDEATDRPRSRATPMDGTSTIPITPKFLVRWWIASGWR